MRSTRLVNAVLLLAALGVVGCSKRDTKKMKTPNDSAATTKPVTAPIERPAATAPTGQSSVALASLTVPISSSFEDGKVAYDAKNYKEAAAIFEAYLERKPGNAWGYYMLGLSAWKSGDFPKSEKAFEKALSIDPNHVKSLVNASRLFIDQKRYDDAVDWLTRAAEIDPESAEVQRLLAKAYTDLAKPEEAMAAYLKAIDLNEADAWSMNNLGLLLLEAKRTDEALSQFQNAVGLKKNVAEFQNNLGLALESSGNFSAAYEAFSKALLLNPRYAEAKLNIARVEPFKAGPGSK
jgi:tetratricopeptide (TPR) repeat protein